MALRSLSTGEGHHPPAPPAELGGRWHDQLGSELVLDVGTDGTVRGSYRTATGTGSEAGAPVHGSWGPGAGGRGAVLGFAVTWPTVRAVTTWCGRYRPVDDVIEASWLMCTDAGPGDQWRSNFVGHDVFQRR